MRLWLGWGECLINLCHPSLGDAVKGTRYVGAAIGNQELVAGHITAGELRWLEGKLVPGSNLYDRSSIQFALRQG